MNIKRTVFAFASAFSLFSMGAFASDGSGVSYSGQIEFKKPELLVDNIGAMYAGVSYYSFDITDKNKSCQLTTIEDVARVGIGNTDPACFLVLDENSSGLKVNGTSLTGYFESPGINTIPYEVLVYSGAEQTAIPIAKGELEFDVADPEPPVVVEIQGNWGGDLKTGWKQENYDPTAALNTIKVSVEERPYQQAVQLPGFDTGCTVSPGREDCSFYVKSEPFGDPEDDVKGTELINVVSNSVSDWFENQLEQDLTVEWDYRKSEILAFDYISTQDEAASKTVSVDGTEIELSADEAVVVIKSPHSDLSDSWWRPSDNRLLLSAEEGVQHTSRLDIEGSRIYFDIPHLNWESEYVVKPSDVMTENGLTVYRYSLNTVPDGLYSASFNAENKYRNGVIKEYPDNLIDRIPPDIAFLFSGRQLKYGTDVYFTEDLGAVAHGGWDDGTQITKMTLGGIELTTEGEADNLQYVTENIDALVNNEKYDFVVEAQDGAGNKASKKLTMTYSPATYELYGVPDSVSQKVQSASIYVSQRRGRCSLATSDETAQLLASPHRKACTINWPETPDGMASVFMGWTTGIEGGANNLGENKVGYEVWYHNDTGNKIKVAEGSDTFNVVEADPLVLTIQARNKLDDGVYGLRYNDSMVTRYRVTTNPAAFSVTSTVEDTGESETRDFNQLPFDKNYDLTGNIDIPNASEREIFERFTVTVDAAYKLNPELKSQKQIEVIKLPYQYVNAYVDIPGGEKSSEEEVPVTVNLGLLQRGSGTFDFDPAKMGEWNVHLAYREGQDMIKITEPVQADNSGEAVFNLAASELFEKSRTVYAIGNLISPHPEYEKEIRSIPAAVEVLKGTGIEGELDSRRVSGRAPFGASVRFAYKTKSDRDASTNLRWETSEDGETWEPASQFNDRQYVNFRLSEPSSIFVRAKVDNKISGETTVTGTLELAAYNVARLDIEGPRQLYKGQAGTFTLANYGEPIHESEGKAEWSVDGGETWEAGEVVQDFAFEEERVELKARFRYNSTSDIVGDEGWSESIKYIQAKEPQPVRLMANVPSLSEAGVPVELTGYAQNPFSAIPLEIMSEWVMPDGSVESAMNAQYTFEEGELQESENLEFTFKAWVKGYKDQTLAEQTRSTKGWSYQFPDMTLTLNSNITVAPSNIYAAVQQPYVFAPNVEFNYEWEIDESVARIEYSNNRSALIVAEESGMHQIKVTVSDNRGNEETLTGYIDVVMPEDMEGQMNIYPSNPHFRAPVILNMSASANPGHPRDYATEYEWMVNGEVIEGATRSAAKKEITEPGSYELSVEVTTNYGQKTRITENVMVVPNENPQCEPVMNTSGSYITLRTQCTDPDGRIIGYRWIWNGEEQGPYGTQIRFNKQQYESLDVTFFAIDDSGGETKGDFSW